MQKVRQKDSIQLRARATAISCHPSLSELLADNEKSLLLKMQQSNSMIYRGTVKIRVVSRGETPWCRLCSSPNEAEFTAEMMIHFGGRKHLENPGVLAFSEILICLDCGSTRFRIAETELKLLRERQRAVNGCGTRAAPLRESELVPTGNVLRFRLGHYLRCATL